MCGIIGVASPEGIQSTTWLQDGLNEMVHRGPDDSGIWISHNHMVSFGHRRLAVIDLSSSGHQPMTNASGSLCIVFNGEIYNHHELRNELISKGYKFISTSDTEVILVAYQEWGIDCIAHLNGMFALAIYDEVRKKIILARDRAGEKPLFYSFHNGFLKFSSELKGLFMDLECSRQINLEALNLYLEMGYVPGEGCIVEGINKLSAGKTLEYDLVSNSIEIKSYWSLPRYSQLSYKFSSPEELLYELELLLEDSVKMQMVSDVPVGILLSGGIDSSLITAMASRHASHIKTFTVGFPQFGKFDESEHAKLISSHYGTEHELLEADEINPNLLPLLARQYDEPIMDSSMIPTYLVSKMVKAQCTVALGGDGGDELFAGYAHHRRLIRAAFYKNFIPESICRSLSIIANLMPTGFKGRNWIKILGYDLNVEIPSVATQFDFKERVELLGVDHAKNVVQYYFHGIAQNETLLQKITSKDFLNYLPEDILVKVDRASMMNSLELRAPFLDSRIIEFAFRRVPDQLKANKSQSKILLKMFANKLFPETFDIKRKQGFSLPLPIWFKKGIWREYAYTTLLEEGCIFNKNVVKSLFDGLDAGRVNSERIYGLLIFELWRREYDMYL